MMFAIMVWWLWKWRCAFVFRHKQLDEMVKIQHLYRYLDQILVAFKIQQQSFFSTSGRTLKLISWKPPNDNWWKLNTDGSSKGNPSLAGGGGVIRDWRWCSGFMINIGVCVAVDAELWAVIQGLSLAWRLGIKKAYP